MAGAGIRDYHVHSLEIFRPVVNMDAENVTAFQHMVETELSRTELPRGPLAIDYYNHTDPRLYLITGEELLNFHQVNGIETTRDNFGRFYDYLNRSEYMPEELRQPVEIPAFPPMVFGGRVGPRAVALLAIGAGDQPVMEQRLMQRVTNRRNHFDEDDETIDAMWSKNPDQHRIPIAKLDGEFRKVNAVLRIMHTVLARSSVIPATLQLGPVEKQRPQIVGYSRPLDEPSAEE